MILQLALVCCAIPCIAAGNTLFFKPHAAPSFKNFTCPDQSQCRDGNTCCQTAQNQFGCCPYKNAVCCPDNVHCCPSGTTCDSSAGRCNRQDGTILPWMQRSSSSQSSGGIVITDPGTDSDQEIEASVVCPGDESECPSGSTCCQQASGSWGCCPLPEEIEASVVCPGDESECPSGSTCCQQASGSWGCCPLPEAVCCSDNVHCCPSGMTCDVSLGACIYDGISITWEYKRPARARKTQHSGGQAKHPCPVKSIKTIEASVVCPGDESECPSGSTCCQQASGSWGCCPLPEEIEASVVCPGDESECPSGSTCCQQASGSWGCCPLPEAVCCSDNVHCCPSGMTCDVSLGACIYDGISITWEYKRPARARKTQHSGGQAKHHCPVKSIKTIEASVVCPGDESECPSGSTCCQQASGSWGCCPLPEAVCCSDNVHCCPSGMTCDVSLGACIYDGISITWEYKRPARARKTQHSGGQAKHPCPVKSIKEIEASVVCPGDESECPSGSTCCQQASGSWGCCPLPEAVCCSDNVHCCPSGMTCDVSLGACIYDGISITWEYKRPARARKTQHSGGQAKHPCPVKSIKEIEASVVCPGDESECPSGSTCCQQASGSWGCCPLPEAVCCSDNVHCCPSGMTCDVSLGACIYDGISITWEYKRPARARKTQHSGGQAKHPCPVKSIKEIEASVVCPGDESECPSGSTCCQQASGSWGCCPLPEAVCCSDNVHCCPSGMTCDVSLGACIYDGISITWEYKRPARARKTQHSGGQAKHPCPVKSIKEIEASVVCPGDESECPSGSTCCQQASGSWGCCPLPEAVCCSDNVHCCPSGMTCDVSLGACIYDGISITWEYKRPARARKTQHSGGQAKHPCPVKSIKKIEASVVCPGDESECPSGSTCCQQASGSWGCCPLPEAVCCSDNVHCCPSGMTCDVSLGACIYDGISITWEYKRPARARKTQHSGGQAKHPSPDKSFKVQKDTRQNIQPSLQKPMVVVRDD